MRFLAGPLLLFVVLSAPAWAQNGAFSDAAFTGHLIGESVADFLRIEPEAQQEADVCRQRAERRRCSDLIAALDRGQRAEVSTASSANFVLDAGKLVKFTVLVDANVQAVSDGLTRKFGPLSKLTALPVRDSSGTKWSNHLYTWDTSAVYVTLYQDNNPSLEDHRLLLIVESHAEHLLEDLNQSPQSGAVASSVPSPPSSPTR